MVGLLMHNKKLFALLFLILLVGPGLIKPIDAPPQDPTAPTAGLQDMPQVLADLGSSIVVLPLSQTSSPEALWTSPYTTGDDKQASVAIPNNSPQNEPTVAINMEFKRDGRTEQVVAGANDYRLGPNSACGIYTSDDGGLTWTDRGIIPVDPFARGWEAGGDPVIRSGRSTDIFYYVCLHFNRTTGNNGITLWKTTDGGTTWDLFATIALGTNSNDFHDKPWIAVDTNNRSPYVDNVYVCWVHFTATSGDILFRRVTDANPRLPGGAILGPVRTLSDSASNQGCSVAVKKTGEVGVSWTDFTNSQIKFRKSNDPNFLAGAGFGPIATVQNIGSYFGNINACGGTPRAFSYPDLESTRFPGSGYWVIVYTSLTPHGPVGVDSGIDVFSTRSLGGFMGSWSAPVRLNDDLTGIAGVHQFMQSATVNDGGNSAFTGGIVFAHWQDERDDDDASCLDYGDHSHDMASTYLGNQVIQDVPVVATASFGGKFMGDYQDVSTAPTNSLFPPLILPIFHDSRNGNQDVFVDPGITGLEPPPAE